METQNGLGAVLGTVLFIVLGVVWALREVTAYRASRKIEEQHRAAIETKDAHIERLNTEIASLDSRTSTALAWTNLSSILKSVFETLGKHDRVILIDPNAADADDE